MRNHEIPAAADPGQGAMLLRALFFVMRDPRETADSQAWTLRVHRGPQIDGIELAPGACSAC